MVTSHFITSCRPALHTSIPMARNLLHLSSFFIFISLLLVPVITGDATKFGKRLSPLKLGLKNEKLTHFRVYLHDVVGGPKPSAVSIVRPQNYTATTFGAVSMIDDALTMGPKLDSKLVGRAQGLYALAGQNELSLMMVMNFVFVEGKYNGSTISILGRNAVLTKMREMPIIGGSGLFRFARGYVQVRIYRFDTKSGDSTVEYNV